jgi:hypothetical protein
VPLFCQENFPRAKKHLQICQILVRMKLVFSVPFPDESKTKTANERELTRIKNIGVL